jgi:hypothetical protein
MDLIMIRIMTLKILMPPRIDQDQNPGVEYFVAPKRNRFVLGVQTEYECVG